MAQLAIKGGTPVRTKPYAQLLGDEKDVRDIAEAIIKIQANAGELADMPKPAHAARRFGA